MGLGFFTKTYIIKHIFVLEEKAWSPYLEIENWLVDYSFS